MSKSITITLTDTQIAQLAEINKTRNYTPESLIAIIVERGIYALQYRTKYNAKKANELREYRSWKQSQ